MDTVWFDLAVAFVLALVVVLNVLQLAGSLGWVERKGSALIQDRIGANRAAIFGFTGFGLVNTLMADPLKFLTKEDVIPAGVDRFFHTLAPCIHLFPALVAFAVIPFGDVLLIGGHEINLQVAPLNIGILYILAMVSLGVYGVVLGGWASNNRWSLLGGIRGSAQMISYELAMGLALVAMIMLYDTLDLQAMARAQGGTILGVLPDWGIFYQPLAFLIFLTAGIAESKRVPFDLPESESELVSGFFTEYSGTKHLMFFMTDFVEVIIVAGLATTLFFGGWQVPFLARDGFHFPGGATLLLPNLVVAILQIVSFSVKVLFFCWLQIMIRWTLPRFRYDQLMHLGWIGLLPLGFLNAIVTALVILAWGSPDMGFALFFVLAALLIGSAVGVVLSRHPVRSAMSLVTTLFVLAVFFIFLDADFVAALQVVVYAGAIMVVFLFVIMLLNLQEDLPPRRVGHGLTALGLASLFTLVLLYFLRRAGTLLPGPGMATDVPAGFGTTEAVGLRLFTHYLLPFEITGLLMLASVIGAVVLAKRKVG